MKLISLLVALFVFGCAHAPHYEGQSSKSDSTTDSIMSSTVVILASVPGEFAPMCSGVWVSSNHILTAQHCVTDTALDFVNNKIIDVTPALGKEIFFLTKKDIEGCNCHSLTKSRTAKLIYQDVEKDLALLEFNYSIPKTIVNLERPNYTVGSSVRIVGHPKGQMYTLTLGYVSNVRTKSFQVRDTNDKFIDAVQVSSFATSGNSGGGAFSEDGKLIGIASFRLTEPGYMFFVTNETINVFLKKAYYATKSTKLRP